MSRRRRLLGAALLALLVAGAGCAAFGPGQVDEERLSENVSYAGLWNSSADAAIEIEKNRYKVAFRIENRSSVEIYRFRRFNNERPIDPIGVRFRHPDGTVVNHTAMAFEKKRSRTVVTLPAENGTLAYSAPKSGKRIRVPAVVEGSYEVILPPDTHVRYPLLGRVIPRGYDWSEGGDGRVHLRWDGVSGDRVVVQYYLVRDLYMFAGLLVVSSVVVAGGIAYFWLQLRTLRERREQVAWNDGGK